MIVKFSRPEMLKQAYFRINEERVSDMNAKIRENDHGLREINCEFVKSLWIILLPSQLYTSIYLYSFTYVYS
jgi:hypothetical protein